MALPLMIDERNGEFRVMTDGRETEGEDLPKYYVITSPT
jgi:hypothetical protein